MERPHRPERSLERARRNGYWIFQWEASGGSSTLERVGNTPSTRVSTTSTCITRSAADVAFVNRDGLSSQTPPFSRREFVRLCSALAACPAGNRALTWAAITGLTPSQF